MATPAYFFIGTGQNAKNVGMRYYDGSPNRILPTLYKNRTVSSFKQAAKRLSDETFAEVGPVSWDDANYNYVYALDHGKIRVFEGNDADGKEEIRPDASRRGDRRSLRQTPPASALGNIATTVYSPRTSGGTEIGLPEILIISVGALVGGYFIYKTFSGPTG